MDLYFVLNVVSLGTGAIIYVVGLSHYAKEYKGSSLNGLVANDVEYRSGTY